MADTNNEDERQLELMRLKSEHARVHGAKAEMEYIIAQRQAEIKRVAANVVIQDKRLTELEQQMSNLQKGA